MKIFIFLFTITFFQSCFKNKEGNMSSVFEKYDSSGRLIEKWGNKHQRDDESDFRTFYYYDSSGRLIKERSYVFDEPNPHCEIGDSLAYIDIVYEYDSLNSLILEKRYFPELNSEGKITGHKLGFIHDYATGESKSIDE